MRIIKSIIASSAVLCSLCVHAGKNYYVDAENGNDLWDGSTSVEPTPEQQLLDPIPGPKKTLAAAMAIPGLTSGDIVYAAEGSYTSETIEYSSALYRVVVPQGVRLIASGKAENTYIVGESSPIGTEGNDDLGNGPGAVRCAYLDKDAHIIGFTLTGGRTPTTARGAAASGRSVPDGELVERGHPVHPVGSRRRHAPGDLHERRYLGAQGAGQGVLRRRYINYGRCLMRPA